MFGGIGLPEFIILLFIFVVGILPLIINANLAKSRGKSVALMILLTFFFSWIVTLILAFKPRVDAPKS